MINSITTESTTNPKYTPAITIVLLCSKELIGVGANIAFNNQEKKGYCADFENITTTIQIISKGSFEGILLMDVL